MSHRKMGFACVVAAALLLGACVSAASAKIITTEGFVNGVVSTSAQANDFEMTIFSSVPINSNQVDNPGLGYDGSAALADGQDPANATVSVLTSPNRVKYHWDFNTIAGRAPNASADIFGVAVDPAIVGNFNLTKTQSSYTFNGNVVQSIGGVDGAWEKYSYNDGTDTATASYTLDPTDIDPAVLKQWVYVDPNPVPGILPKIEWDKFNLANPNPFVHLNPGQSTSYDYPINTSSTPVVFDVFSQLFASDGNGNPTTALGNMVLTYAVVAPVPEPSTIVLAAMGVAGVAMSIRRRKK